YLVGGKTFFKNNLNFFWYRCSLGLSSNISRYFLLHLAFAAFLAISLRCSGVSFSALALPPLRPPRLPSSTAAGFFCGPVDCSGLESEVACSAMKAASWFMSRGAFDFFML
ncbi:MAG: hypothetical protein ACLQJ7_15545, partial [Syntrophobacteraceae bacterium]